MPICASEFLHLRVLRPLQLRFDRVDVDLRRLRLPEQDQS
jgi:hypothetical protein